MTLVHAVFIAKWPLFHPKPPPGAPGKGGAPGAQRLPCYPFKNKRCRREQQGAPPEGGFSAGRLSSGQRRGARPLKNLPPPRAAMGGPQRKPENALLVPVGHSLPPDPSIPTSQWKSSVQLCDGHSIILLLRTFPSAPTSHHTSNAHPRPVVRAVLGLKKEERFSCPLLQATNFSPSGTPLSPQAWNSLLVPILSRGRWDSPAQAGSAPLSSWISDPSSS